MIMAVIGTNHASRSRREDASLECRQGRPAVGFMLMGLDAAPLILVPEYSQGMAATHRVGPHRMTSDIGARRVDCCTAMRVRSGLCDWTQASCSSNGTPEHGLEDRRAARVLGAAWSENSGGPTAASRRHPNDRCGGRHLRRGHRPGRLPIPYTGTIGIPITRASEVLSAAGSPGPRGTRTGGPPPWRADWICSTSSTMPRRQSYVIEVSAHYERKKRALACYASQLAEDSGSWVPTRLDGAELPSADSRAATRSSACARRCRLERGDREETGGAADTPAARPMRIGIV